MAYKFVNADQLDADLTTVANAIRTKGNTSEQLVFPSGMVSAISTISTGVELNFEVVGNPQPSNPKENTIWVNTDTKINGYVFSSEQPDITSSATKTASGQTVSFSGASDGPLSGLKIYGKTTQNGTPTPDAPVPLKSVGDGGSVGVTVCGKNFLNKNKLKGGSSYGVTYTKNDDGSFKRTGTSTIDGGDVWFFGGWYSNIDAAEAITILQPGETYYARDCILFMGQYNSVKNVFTVDANTFPNGYKVTGVRCTNQGNGTTFDDTIYPMIVKGSAYPEWEPFAGTTATFSTPNGLPGIPVSSGGNYTDENGQQWICDEVDCARGKRVQRTNILILNGNNDVQFSVYNGQNIYSHAVLKDCKKINSLSIIGLCNAIGRNVGYNTLNSQYVAHSTIDSGIEFIKVAENFGLSEVTVEAFNSYLQENPIEILYPIETPIETDLTAEELAQYSALHTNYPNTTIYNDAGADMEVKYSLNVGGLVWIVTEISSTVEFNALKKNAIQVYPTSAKQYISGEWKPISAYIYQVGKWVQFSYERVYIFQEGKGVAKGYEVKHYNSNSGFVLDDDKITFATNSNVGEQVWIEPKINLSSFERLYVELTCTGRYDARQTYVLGVGPDLPTGQNSPGTFDASVSDVYDSERTIYEVPISNVSGERYIKFDLFAITGYIHNIWLE